MKGLEAATWSETRPWWGVAAALAILGAWFSTLFVGLRLELPRDGAWSPVMIALQTFLHTGLFITAHDGMHKTIAPGYRRLNDALGQLALLLYALFSMKLLCRAHVEHHRTPASETDPDYAPYEGASFGRWYVAFIRHYLRWYQIVGMALIFNILEHGLGIPVINLLLFWVLPSLLSTLQLFYFGTYRPHRRPPEGHIEPHRARSNTYPPWLSFLTCYHFGYHLEHHVYPGVPWWGLPRMRQKATLPGVTDEATIRAP